MSSIKVILRDTPRKDGTHTVLIRLIADRKTKYIPTGCHVKPNQFKDGEVIRHPDAMLMNATIERKRGECAEIIYSPDPQVFGKPKPSFIKLLRAQQQLYENRNQVAGYWKVESLIKAFQLAWGRDVDTVTKKLVEVFVSDRIARGISPNTLRKELQLATMIHGGPEFKEARSKIKAIPALKEKLTVDEVRVLESAKLQGLEDLARDMFLFSFYTHGMRFESVALFEKKNIKKSHLLYQMEKGRKFREIARHAKLDVIINKYLNAGTPYLFPVIKEKIPDVWRKKNIVDSAATLIRARLKRVGIVCGIEKSLNPHIARHTFADLTKKRGISTEIIKDALGHSKLSTTEIYLSGFKDDVVNDAVNGLYD